MKKLFKQPFFFSFVVAITALCLVISSYVFGWTLPSSTAPNSNLNSPINTSSNNQYKIGYLAIGTSTAPQFPLDVAGVMRIGKYSSAPSGANGALYYDTAANKFKGYQSGSWSDFGGSATELWSTSGSNIYYNSGKVGIGTSTPSYTLTVVPPTGSGYDISICKNAVCCPIWKDCDNDAKTYGSGDCDESCSTCYQGSTSYTFSPDGKDQDCDGTVDEGETDYTLIWIPNVTYDGNLGGRSGADSKCVANTPGNLPATCDTNKIHAFLSTSLDDEVQDMPTNYGYQPNSPLKWFYSGTGGVTTFANNWSDALDGSISVNDLSGTGFSGYRWSGTTSSGGLTNSNCSGWTYNLSDVNGSRGYYNAVDGQWLSYTTIANCSTIASHFIRCAILCGGYK